MISTLFSCKYCGLREIEIEVPDPGGMDDPEWLNAVAGPIIQAEHERRSPSCSSKKVLSSYLPLMQMGIDPHNLWFEEMETDRMVRARGLLK